MKHIEIQTIPHEEQRYPTVGDWELRGNGDIKISVSDMNNWRYELLVAFHELVEVMLCKDQNITQQEVDEFDIQFEKNRLEYQWPDNLEPGNDPRAPYRKQHRFAENLERMFAHELGVDWDLYNKTVEEL